MHQIRFSYRFGVLGFVLGGLLLLAACTTNRAPQPAGPTETAPAATAGFNEADITFMQGMIGHHAQAIEMAKLAADRAAHPELEQLAVKIIADQSTEIDTMKRLLTQAGAKPPSEGMEGMGHGGMAMPGMMDDQQMSQLQSLQGERFDLRFLEMMTTHHQGAIKAAQQVLEKGENPQVADLARQIIKAQQAEIEQMAGWRQQWSAA